MKIEHNVSLKPYNSFHVDVACDTFVEIEKESELQDYLTNRNQREPLFVIGDGCNLLFVQDFHGTILKMENRGISIVDSVEGYRSVKAAAGENWDSFVRYSLENHCYGLENLALIPGKVGSVAVQNIGAYGREVCDFIDKVYAVDIKENRSLVFTKETCCFGYRDSIFKREWKGRYVITAVEFRLSAKSIPYIHYADIKHRLEGVQNVDSNIIYQVVSTIRQEKLPDIEVLGNAGSFFKNPIVEKSLFEALLSQYSDLKSFSISDSLCKLSAAQLIEKCGWKGKRLGRAGVYHKQPLVLVNHGGATGLEILKLAEKIQQDVMERFGVCLEMEVNII